MSANLGQSSCSFRRTIISTAGLDRKTDPFRPNFKVIRVALFHHDASVLDPVGPTVIITSEVPITAHCCGLVYVTKESICSNYTSARPGETCGKDGVEDPLQSFGVFLFSKYICIL